jgi:hypothetical protein
MPAWMPQELPGSTPKRRKVDSLGCGHYGCVFLTNTPGLVIKISSDPSEAEFVKAAVKIGEWPVGIVRYQAVLDLPGTHRNRGVFIIWREEAFDIGKVYDTGQDWHAAREFSRYHTAYLNAARFVRGLSRKSAGRFKESAFPRQRQEAAAYEDWAWNNVIWEDGLASGSTFGFMRYRGAQRLAAALRICHICFELMENTNYAHEVGAALGFYLDQGILLADVHLGNIGRVERDDPNYGPQIHNVITDPGHAVFLR